MKACSNCGKTKAFTEFNKRRKSVDGLQSACRECQSALFREMYKNNKQFFIEKAAFGPRSPNLKRQVRKLYHSRSDKYSDLLGCSPNELVKAWEHQGFFYLQRDSWIIKMKKPIKEFDNPRSAFHYSNLQPCFKKK